MKYYKYRSGAICLPEIKMLCYSIGYCSDNYSFNNLTIINKSIYVKKKKRRSKKTLT